MDLMTRETLIAVLRDQSVSVTAILRVLADEGHTIGVTSLRTARECALGVNPACKCSIFEKDNND